MGWPRMTTANEAEHPCFDLVASYPGVTVVGEPARQRAHHCETFFGDGDDGALTGIQTLVSHNGRGYAIYLWPDRQRVGQCRRSRRFRRKPRHSLPASPSPTEPRDWRPPMRRIAASIGLALLLLVTLVLPVSAGERRPVRGQFEGSGAEVAQRCPGALTIGFDINGVLSHLGRMTGGGTNCTEFTLGTESVPDLGRHRRRDRRRRLDSHPCLRGTARGADQRRCDIQPPGQRRCGNRSVRRRDGRAHDQWAHRLR